MQITIENHPALIQAYKDYMRARQMVRQGLLGNASAQREHLRAVFRFLIGK